MASGEEWLLEYWRLLVKAGDIRDIDVRRGRDERLI